MISLGLKVLSTVFTGLCLTITQNRPTEINQFKFIEGGGNQTTTNCI